MSRYWRVYRAFFSTSLVREMEFRANFFAKILQNAVWIGFFILVLLVVYGNTDSIAGWSRGEALVLAATVFLLSAASAGLFFSIHEIPQQVRMGVLDYVITKPVDTQFWVSMRRFNFDQVGTLAGAIVLLVFGMGESGIHPDPVQWLAYAVLVLCSLAIFYSFSLALMTTGIWFVRVDNLWVLSQSIVQVARFPIDIYKLAIQRFFTYAFPLAFLATIPARQLVEGLDLGAVALGIVWALVGLVFSRAFWNFALRYYGSASS